MKFIDEARIYIKSGSGGKGCVSFHREKYVPDGGPDGGDGGSGGDIIFKTNPNVNTLVNYRYNQHYKAKDGANGKGRNCTGKSSPNLILEVPLGTQILSEDKNILLYDFTQEDEEFTLLKGGKGGLGNARFKSSINQAPTKTLDPELGEELNIWLHLKLLSDVGIIGLPNAGKSTFLSRVSRAKPKIANYPFTTLTPNLGVVYVDGEEFVMADIPGLIEGASCGHGLGDKFLKHIERCHALLHIIDITSEDISKDYKTIRNELEQYSPALKDKTEIIALSKTDLLSDEECQAKVKDFKQIANKSDIFLASIADSVNLKSLLRELNNTKSHS